LNAYSVDHSGLVMACLTVMGEIPALGMGCTLSLQCPVQLSLLPSLGLYCDYQASV